MSHKEVSTLFIVVRLEDVVDYEVGLFIFNVFGVGVSGGKLLGETADAWL